MRRAHLLARLCRALAGQTQEKFGEAVGIHPSLISQIELGLLEADAHLPALAGGAGLTVADADALLSHYEALRQARRRRTRGEVELVAPGHATAFERLLALPRPVPRPRITDRRRAAEQWSRLAALPAEIRLAVVRVAEEFQNWALCEAVCAESVRGLERAVEPAAALARLAQEIAARARGPESFLNRLRGYAAAHEANVLRGAGRLIPARAMFAAAMDLWEQGSDPEGLLDPGPLLDLEAALFQNAAGLDEGVDLPFTAE